MQRTLREHILSLETKLQTLNDMLTSAELTGTDRESVLAQIHFAEYALGLYRKAYELENAVTISLPSGA